MYTQVSDLLHTATPYSIKEYFIIILLLSLVIASLLVLASTGKPACNVPYVKSVWYFGPPQWTMSTYKFIVNSVKEHGGLFTFRFRNMDVVFVSGQRWRHAIFSDRRLDLIQGMKLISVHAKQIIHPDGGEKATTAWMARELSRSSHLTNILPEFVSDMNRHARTLPPSGRVNLFDNNQLLMFRLILRYFGPVELTDDDETIKGLLRGVGRLEAGSSLSATFFPGIPTPARVWRLMNVMHLFRKLSKAIDKRKVEGMSHRDGLQLTLDHGYSNKDSIITLLSAYVVSMLNTGTIMSWMHVYLFTNREYLNQVLSEISNFTSTHSAFLKSDQPANIPSELLADLENPETFPMLDACIMETLRLRTSNVAVFRRNVSREAIVVDGVSVPSGSFLLYPLGDAHMASSLWGESNVFSFAPERFIGRDDNAKLGDFEKTQGDFLGFGAGAHVCTGKRLARLLIKMCTIFILSNYDCQVTDSMEQSLTHEPLSDPVFLKLSLPNKGHEAYLKYKLKEKPGFI